MFDTARSLLNARSQTMKMSVPDNSENLPNGHIVCILHNFLCSLGKRGFITSLCGGVGPCSHNRTFEFSIIFQNACRLFPPDLWPRSGACLDISNRSTPSSSIEDAEGEDCADERLQFPSIGWMWKRSSVVRRGWSLSGCGELILSDTHNVTIQN